MHIHQQTGQLVVGTNTQVNFAQPLGLGIVFNYESVLATVDALLAHHGLPQQINEAAEVQITETSDPPARPERAEGEWGAPDRP